MDTSVIAKSPARLTVSGMGDALATYFEARATKTAIAAPVPAEPLRHGQWRWPNSATKL